MPMEIVTCSDTTKREVFKALDVQVFRLPPDDLVCKCNVLEVTQVTGAIMDGGCGANLMSCKGCECG